MWQKGDAPTQYTARISSAAANVDDIDSFSIYSHRFCAVWRAARAKTHEPRSENTTEVAKRIYFGFVARLFLYPKIWQ